MKYSRSQLRHPRQKKALVRKYTNHIRILRNVFLVLLIPILFYLFVYKYRVFDIKEVMISGAKSYVNQEDLHNVVSTNVENKNIFFLNTEELEASLQDNFQGAKTISISKKLPNKLEIVVKEREPLALIHQNNEEIFMVDEDGYVLGLVDKTKTNLPKIKYEGDIKIGYFINKEFVPVYLQLLDSVDSNKINVSSISVSAKNISMYVDGGIHVVLSQEKSTVESVSILSKLLKQLHVEGKNAKKIDLRYDKVIVSYE